MAYPQVVAYPQEVAFPQVVETAYLPVVEMACLGHLVLGKAVHQEGKADALQALPQVEIPSYRAVEILLGLAVVVALGFVQIDLARRKMR